MWLDTLLANGTISEEQLEDARALTDRRGISLERACVEWQYLTWEQIAPLKAADNGVPYLAATEISRASGPPNTCPLCHGALTGCEMWTVGLWDGAIEDTREKVYGPVCDCYCPRCWARLTSCGDYDVPISDWMWTFDPCFD